MRAMLQCLATVVGILAAELSAHWPAGTGASSAIREMLIGAWELVSTEDVLTDGTRRPYPYAGPHGKGYLIYTADGHMCAQLMNPDRPRWKDPDHPTDAEKVSALDGFVAYCGRYEVDETQSVIYHLPETAWIPRYVGTRQRRPYVLQGDLLTFADRINDEPGVASYTITWRKVKPNK